MSRTLTRNPLNGSKPPRMMPVYPIPDPDRLPLTTVDDLRAATATDTPAYRAGYDAGRHWAQELATFAELQALEQDARSPFMNVPSWTRGYIDGALAVLEEPVGAA